MLNGTGNNPPNDDLEEPPSSLLFVVVGILFTQRMALSLLDACRTTATGAAGSGGVAVHLQREGQPAEVHSHTYTTSHAFTRTKKSLRLNQTEHTSHAFTYLQKKAFAC